MQKIACKYYDILFISDINLIIETINQRFKPDKFCIITDENVFDLYSQSFINQLPQQNLIRYILRSGEINKNLKNIELFHDFLFKNNFQRTDIVIGFGGGLITDFAGFASSTYMRGIKFISIPTSIIGISDAAIGSKTAINNDYGKNLVGAFYDPVLIIVNTSFLTTLDDRNFSNGLAEIIKAGLIMDKQLFNQLCSFNIKTIRQDKNFAQLQQILKRSMEIKVSVIEEDKLEKDLRKILNFGHTIGHGIEFASKEQLLHGECVSIGMILACEIAQRLKILLNPLDTIQQIRQCLQNYNLPLSIPEIIDKKAIFYYMQQDKKKEQNQIHFVLLKQIGEVYIKTYPISSSIILEIISDQVLIGKALSYFNNTQINNQYKSLQISLPGSKSIINRMLIIASLSNQEVTFSNFLDAEDTNVMLNALEQLSACIILKRDNKSITIKGTGGQLKQPNSMIYTANSGTASRFLSTLLLLVNGFCTMTCSERMQERPMNDLLEVLEQQAGVKISCHHKQGHLPFDIHSSHFEGGIIEINGKTSSQFITSLLLSSPYAKNQVKIIIKDFSPNDQIVSEPFIEMTIKLMQKCGIQVQRPQKNIFTIQQGVYCFQTPQFVIEPDAATASYDLAYSILNQVPIQILNIGSDSVQGDIKFAEKLKNAGCQLQISENSITTIMNQEQYIKLNPCNLNFNDCTDTFMTMAVILSTVDGVSTIRGIANQRLKESNRIYAMIRNLMKCEIICKEFDDGIEIHGKDIRKLSEAQQNVKKKKQVLIKTYGDHRLAMSFAILGSYYANLNYYIEIVIDNKICVGKTFPEFWDHMKQIYQCEIKGIQQDLMDLCQQNNYFIKSEPIFLIGMRCSGKSILSQCIAKRFGLKYIDLDDKITEMLKEKLNIQSIKQLVEEKGWNAFRQYEQNELFNIIFHINQYQQTVISCGGGIVDIEGNVSLLKTMRNVIWIQRDINEIKIDLETINSKDNTNQKETDKRPNYINNENIESVYLKRINKYQSCSKFIFSIPCKKDYKKQINDREYWGTVEKMLQKLIRKAIFYQDKRILIKENTYFVCLFVDAIENIQDSEINYINYNYSALEVRADQFFEQELKNNNNDTNCLFRSIEKFNRIIARVKYQFQIPLIFTLRTQPQGGYFTFNQYNYFKILKLIQMSYFFEIIDCEYYESCINKFIKFSKKVRQSTLVLLSKHFIDKIQDCQILKELELIKSYCNNYDILKIVIHKDCSDQFFDEQKRLLLKNNFIPTIIIKLGDQGKLSRVLNNYLTPVYDQRFGPATGAGQMQKNEIIRIKSELSLSKIYNKIYIFGSDISLSYSPAIHNLAYAQLNMGSDHIFERVQIQKVEEIMPYLYLRDFGGACLTMPFKKELITKVDKLHNEAAEIGVINTLINYGGYLHGFNTDWYGILRPLQKRLQQDKRNMQINDIDNYALVIGAGATTETVLYCLKRLQINPIIFNRTQDKIDKLIQKNKSYFDSIIGFNDMNLVINHLINNKLNLKLIISTIPGKIQIDYPDEIFSLGNPIIFEAAYFPKETSLIKAAVKNKCQNIIYGIEMLIYQAFLQIEIFTGKRVKRSIIKQQIMTIYEKGEYIF